MMTGQKHRFAFGIALLLAACSQGGVEDPAVVLERAVSTAAQLQSASFDAMFSYDASDPASSAKGTFTGVLADGGKSLSFSLDGQLTMEADGADQTVSVLADVVVAGEQETYLRIARLEGSILFLPGIGLVPAEMLDRWLSMGGGDVSDGMSVTPDPSFIVLQTQALVVTKDRSYEEVDGEDCYTYDVTIDPVKTVAFLERIAEEQGRPFDRSAAESFITSYDSRGTIWIDAETSVIRRITWDFLSVGDAPRSHASFSFHLTKHNEPVTITPPAGAVPMADVLPNAPLPAL